MRAHEPIDPELLLANAGFIRNLARSLLADEHSADDVVQETWLAALMQTSGPRSSLTAWLAGVSRHLALQVVRRRERTDRREQAASRPEALPSAAEVAERWDMLRQVVDAVEKLEEPYRMTLLLRYFEDLGPRAIALRMQVPLETVRTRLRRGLEQLRTRLDHDHGGDRKAWCLALAPLADQLAGGATAAVIPATASLLAAACIMTLKSKVVLAAALLVALTASVWVAVGNPAGEPNAKAPDRAAHATATNETVPKSAHAADATPVPRREAVGAALEPTPDQAVIRGRCVGEDRAPLAGCEVALHGSVRKADPTSEQAPSQPWKNPEPLLTGADGTFRFAFAPPAAFSCTLDATLEDRCPLHGVWRELRPGQQIDLGDVKLRTGAHVRGTMTDASGAPAAPARISLGLQGQHADGSLAPRTETAKSREDGAFEFRYPLVPGRWSLSVSGEEDLVRPRELIVLDGQRVVSLEVVVRRPDPAAVLSGVVLDETGAPVPRVRLEAQPTEPAGNSGSMTSTSNQDGSFELRRRGESQSPVWIRSRNHEEFERLEEERTFTWGTKEIRLKLQRTAFVEVLVVAAETGKPVEDFSVRCLPESTPYSIQLGVTRMSGRHEEGRLRVPRVAIGRNMLIVFPKDPALSPSEPITFERTESGALPLRVALQHSVELTVHLVTRDGRPVAGAILQLARPWGEMPLTLESTVATMDLAFKHIREDPMAILLSQATTDEQGRAVLCGPASQDLAVRAPGPGHVPLIREHVVLAKDAGPLEIVVAVGATLRGKVKPAEVLTRLTPEHFKQREPGLRLKSLDTQRKRLPPSPDEPRRIERDGSFSLRGIPPGSWEIELEWWDGMGGTGSGSGFACCKRNTSLLVVRDLAEGEDRELELDASGLLPARLKCQVMLEGLPCANAKVGYQRALPDWRGGKTLDSGATGHRTDAEGRFELELPPGYYQILLMPGSPGGPDVRLASDEWVWLDPDKELQHVVQLTHRRAKVRIFTSDGVTPVRARTFFADGKDFERAFWPGDLVPRSDQEGTLWIDPAPLGPFRISTWPPEFDERLAKPEEREQQRIVLGTVQLPSGAKEATFELRMPAGSR